jgi:FKBP-type peptidyl-prolyl cis-trans isomerase FkpA
MKRTSILFAFLCAAAGLAQAQRPTPATPAQPAASAAVAQAEATPADQQAVVPGSAEPGPAAEKLIITDHKIGKGAEAIVGSTVYMHYTGWLYRPLAKNQRGRKFDSSLPRGEPLDFKLGTGKVIKGWDQGIVGMKVGGKRTLIIPAELAYGARAMGDIPPNSALIFDVELMDVK